MTTIVQDQNTTRRTIAGIAVAALTATACLFGGVAGADAAEAAWVSQTRAGEHKPKSWICKTFNICKTTGHYYCGDPTKAYTKPQPCKFRHNDRY